MVQARQGAASDLKDQWRKNATMPVSRRSEGLWTDVSEQGWAEVVDVLASLASWGRVGEISLNEIYSFAYAFRQEVREFFTKRHSLLRLY